MKSRIFLAFAAVVFVAGDASAASYCKGLSQTACLATQGCQWWQALTRKDGVNVRAHCRKSTRKK